MQSTLIAAVLNYYQIANRSLKQLASDILRQDQLGQIARPFQIHFTVETRTPAQIQVHSSCRIQPYTVLNGRSSVRVYGISLGPDTYIKERCYLDSYGGFIDIRGKCAFAQGCFLHGGGGLIIGEHVIVGPNSSIIASNHNYQSRDLPIMLQGDARKGITIGNNVWVGASTVILDGVTVGSNVVIGAGSVITKDVPGQTLIANGTNKRIQSMIDWTSDDS